MIETENYVMRRLGAQGAETVVGSGERGEAASSGPATLIGLNTPRMAIQGARRATC